MLRKSHFPKGAQHLLTWVTSHCRPLGEGWELPSLFLHIIFTRKTFSFNFVSHVPPYFLLACISEVSLGSFPCTRSSLSEGKHFHFLLAHSLRAVMGHLRQEEG